MSIDKDGHGPPSGGEPRPIEPKADPSPDLAFLEGTPVFGALERSALELIAGHLQRRVLPASSLVVAEGEGAREMYVVERGGVEVRVHCDSGDADALVVATLGPGDCFGEMALLDIQPRSATVRTTEETSLLVLRYRELREIRQRDPEAFLLLILNLAREVSRRLRASERHLIDLLRRLPEGAAVAREIFGSRRG
jgi:CRP-like cAMP-binding protein